MRGPRRPRRCAGARPGVSSDQSLPRPAPRSAEARLPTAAGGRRKVSTLRVVIGVGLAIQQHHLGNGEDGLHDRIDLTCVAAFGKLGTHSTSWRGIYSYCILTGGLGFHERMRWLTRSLDVVLRARQSLLRIRRRRGGSRRCRDPREHALQAASALVVPSATTTMPACCE